MRNIFVTKDRIFWIATAIAIVSVAIAMITQEQLWLFLLIASYLLRPTLASLGLAHRYVDERELSIQYRAGNLGFAVMMITCVTMAVSLAAKGDKNWDLFNLPILLGLAGRAVFSVVLRRRLRAAARTMITAVGLFVAFFAAASHGASWGGLIEASPGLIVAALGIASNRFPRTIGAVVIVFAVAAMIFIVGMRFTAGQFATAALIGIPLILAGVGLMRPDPPEPVTTSSPSSIP